MAQVMDTAFASPFKRSNRPIMAPRSRLNRGLDDSECHLRHGTGRAAQRKVAPMVHVITEDLQHQHPPQLLPQSETVCPTLVLIVNPVAMHHVTWCCIQKAVQP
jgi:hypothetical protein